MAKRTPQGHLVSIELRIGCCVRHKDAKRLDRYMCSPEFIESLTALGPEARKRALGALARAQIECGSKRAMPLPRPRATKMDWKDPANVERLKAAWARHKSDRGIAQEMNIHLDAAKIARWKIIGAIKPRSLSPSAGAVAT